MLKAKVHSRVHANRNLSHGILQEEQFNHLSYATNFMIPTTSKTQSAYVTQIEGNRYSFFAPKATDELSDLESKRLKTYYIAYFKALAKDNPNVLMTRQQINNNFMPDIVKYSRLQLFGDVDTISSTWNESRRTLMTSSRLSSVIRYTEYRINITTKEEYSVDRYGRVIYFFCHILQQSTRMLAYIQTYNTIDHSSGLGDLAGGKVVELLGNGANEIICVSAIDSGIGTLSSDGKCYLVNRHSAFQNPDA